MKTAKVFVNSILAGHLMEVVKGSHYEFRYLDAYPGPPISLTMPVEKKHYQFDRFPPFFEGVLPEGMMLEGLLKKAKLDRADCFEQLLRVGAELVGNVTVERDL